VYAMASRITIVPMELFSTSLSQVFFQKAARAQEVTGSFWGQMKLNLALMAVVTGAVVVAIWLFARAVVDIYLGSEWALVGDVLIILAPMLALRSIAVSVATAVFIIKRPAWLFMHNLAAALAQGAAFAFALWGGLDMRSFLMVAATLMAIESASFILILVVAARRRHLGRAAPVDPADRAAALATAPDAG
ncbi:MAG TPA: oligosaccharide flippase family protein, partial [Allosphingosinicella sp.]|nr:oligosaccharide flippase family protein [Allosphingosinicella sp.]